MTATHQTTTADAPRVAQALRANAARLFAKAGLSSQTGAQDMLDAASLLEGLQVGEVVQTFAPAPTDLAARGLQAWRQCKAVAYMARALAEVHEDRALILCHSENFTEEIGATSAALMEWLGDALSNMDAMEGEQDAWLDPVFESAQATWPTAPPTMTAENPHGPAERDVLAERRRQISELGRDEGHDVMQNKPGDLSRAAASYALNAGQALDLADKTTPSTDTPPAFWPWAPQWWNPKTAREDLVRAGALILAEIDRMATQPSQQSNDRQPPSEATT